MKKFLAILILIFVLQTPSQADDIRDFQIEGISLGDSLLNYFSEAEIKKEEKLIYPNSKKFYGITPSKKYELYDDVSFMLKSKDKDYKIYALKGLIAYENKLNECLEEKDKILKVVSSILENSKEHNYTDNFKGAAGKSIAYISDFKQQDGQIRVWCSDWDQKTETDKGWTDDLNVSVETVDFKNWINNEAYK